MTAGAHRSLLRSAGSLRWPWRRVAALDGRAVADADYPPLAPAERVLVTVADAEAGRVVATTAALHWRAGDRADGPWRRVAWFDVDAVGWEAASGSPASGSLTLTAWTTGETWRVGLGGRRHSRLVALVRERVSATVLIRRRVTLAGGGAVVVSARRRDGSAPVEWVVVVPGAARQPGSVEDGVRDEVVSAIRRLRAELGV